MAALFDPSHWSADTGGTASPLDAVPAVRVEPDPLDGWHLVVTGNPIHGTIYVARITGTHATLRYARVFLGTSRLVSRTCREVRVPGAQLVNEDLLEVQTGGRARRGYLVWRPAGQDTMHWLTEAQLRGALALRAPGAAPEPAPATPGPRQYFLKE